MSVTRLMMLGLGAAVLLAAPAAAQRADASRCQRMQNPVACACAVEAGGRVRRNPVRGWRWEYNSRRPGALQTYEACLRRHGR